MEFQQNKIGFNDPITRKTYTGAEEQSCVDKHENLFQLDIEDHNYLFVLTAGITRVKGPHNVEHNFAPHKIPKYKFENNAEKCLFTYKELKKICRKIGLITI